jgi:uncharacterized membrane protein YfcA
VSDLTLIVLVSAVAFLVKGIAGFGGPLLAVPLLAPTLGVERSVAVLALANIVANLMLLWEHRVGAAETKQLLLRLLAAGAVGTVIGTWLLTRLDDRPLEVAMAVLVFVYIAVAVRRPNFHLPRERGLRLSWPVGAVGGLMHGATGNSGTVFGTFIHSLGMDRSPYVYALTVVFLVFGTIQTITLAGLGAFEGTVLTEALWTIIPVVLVTPIGGVIARRLDNRAITWVVLGLLAFSGIRLAFAALGV